MRKILSNKVNKKILFFTIAIFSSHSAQATLIGDTISVQIDNGTVAQVIGSNLINPEYRTGSLSSGLYEINFNANSFTLSLESRNSGFLNSTTWKISDLDWVGMPNGKIMRVFENPGNDSGVSNISFTDDSITINTRRIRATGGGKASWSFNIIHNIPEPSSLSMVMLGLISLSIFRVKGKIRKAAYRIRY